MKTAEERIRILHERAGDLKRQSDRSAVRLLGVTTMFLSVCLVAFITRLTGIAHSMGGGGFAAASLLSESAGAYVLVAVISFAAAVIITVWCIKRRR